MSDAQAFCDGHSHVLSGHCDIMIYFPYNFGRTLCPTFYHQLSDIRVKTSDMSGCPMVFQKHCYLSERYVGSVQIYGKSKQTIARQINDTR